MTRACYKCVYRGEVPGSGHSQCEHPATAPARENVMFMLSSMLGGNRTRPMARVEGLSVVGNPHGIRMGWFAWPLNFDPVWLLHCDGFKAKESVS